jgi:hypothetical protein
MVFKNRVLRRISGPKRDNMVGDEELHNLYFLPNIITMIKSRRMGWTCHVAGMGKGGMHIGYRWEGQKERDNYEDQDVGGWTILKWILETGWGGTDWIDMAQDRDQWRALVNMVMNPWVP